MCSQNKGKIAKGHTFLITITENWGFSFRRNCLWLEFNWWNDWGYKRIKMERWKHIKNLISRVNHVLSMLVNLSLAIRFGPSLSSIEQISWYSRKVYQPILADWLPLWLQGMISSSFFVSNIFYWIIQKDQKQVLTTY